MPQAAAANSNNAPSQSHQEPPQQPQMAPSVPQPQVPQSLPQQHMPGAELGMLIKQQQQMQHLQQQQQHHQQQPGGLGAFGLNQAGAAPTPSSGVVKTGSTSSLAEMLHQQHHPGQVPQQLLHQQQQSESQQLPSHSIGAGSLG